MGCIYIALLSKALYNTHIHHLCTHSYTDGGVDHARQQPAGRAQLGVSRRLAQGHLDTERGGAPGIEPATSQLPDNQL